MIDSSTQDRTREFERRNRLWSFLFDHLNRIIDEIYHHCEEDESVEQATKVISAFQNHIHEFQSLIQWLELNKNLLTTPQRPSSVSWEVKKKLPKHSFGILNNLDCSIKSINFGVENIFIQCLFLLANTFYSKRSLTSTPISNLNNSSKFSHRNSIKNHVLLEENENVSLDQVQPTKEKDNVTQSAQNLEANSKVDLPIVKEYHNFTGTECPVLNRCNSFTSTKEIDQDGFQMVRYKNRNKVTHLKVINNTHQNGNYHTNQHNTTWPQLNKPPRDEETSHRAKKLKAKFATSSQKLSVSETLKKQEERQAKAQEAREKLLEQKAGKFKGIVKKVEEIKAQKEEQQNQLVLSMQTRLQNADRNRQEQIKKIVLKAHDEDSKVSEIQFINTLEAGNKKHDIFSREKVHELRLQDKEKERLQKLEEKASREAAVEQRRRAIQAEKQARLEQLKEQRKLKDMKIEQAQQEKEKERQEIAFQKDLERKSKIDALNALQEAKNQELQKKIATRQEETTRRHEENMEQIRQRALELSVKKSSSGVNDDALVCVPYDKVKMCSLCKVIIQSEVYLFGHLRGKRHNDAILEQNQNKVPSVEELELCNLQSIVDAPLNADNDVDFKNCEGDKLKQTRKKCKKLKQKISSRATQFEKDLEQKSLGEINGFSVPVDVKHKFTKLIKELTLLNGNNKIIGQWPVQMIRSCERSLTELNKLCNQSENNVNYFNSVDGLQLLTKLFSRVLNGTAERPTSLTDSANDKLANVYQTMCLNSRSVCKYFVQSSNIVAMLDIFYYRTKVSARETNVK